MTLKELITSLNDPSGPLKPSVEQYVFVVRNMEHLIMLGVVGHLLGAGYSISVDDGEQTTLQYSRNSGEILHAMATTGLDYLTAHDKDLKYAGYVLLIYGNGQDLISDYSVKLTAVMEPLHAEIDKLVVSRDTNPNTGG